MLYGNEEVSNYLRENFVLHWESVRPVPKVTIDFGDGRVLERTLTGNAIHYVLDKGGRPLDALPGLYGPGAFIENLRRAFDLERTLQALEGDERGETLWAFHRDRIRAIDKAMGEGAISPIRLSVYYAKHGTPARAAIALALTKSGIERGIVEGMEMFTATTALEESFDDALWDRLAANHAEDARLDETSRFLIEKENPDAIAAAMISDSKRAVESPILRMVKTFEASLARDTARNELILHRKLHEWYVRNEVDDTVDDLNERVYAELFLTPSSDPWLGLVPPDTYTGLERGGVKGP